MQSVHVMCACPETIVCWKGEGLDCAGLDQTVGLQVGLPKPRTTELVFNRTINLALLGLFLQSVAIIFAYLCLREWETGCSRTLCCVCVCVLCVCVPIKLC